MSQIFKAYLDDYDLVTVLIDKSYYKGTNLISIYNRQTEVKFETIKIESLDKEIKLSLKTKKEIQLRDDWHVFWDKALEREIYSGKVVRDKQFIEGYNYEMNDLGVSYSPNETVFKLWAPLAKEVIVFIYDSNNGQEVISLSYDLNGVWYVRLDRNLEGYAYYYRVYVNGGWKKVKDPYAIASNANGEKQYIINLEKTYSMQYKYNNPDSVIIYETSIRDFTSDPNIYFVYPSLYLGMIEANKMTPNKHSVGFDYLKDLGITHVQFLPFFDFTGVDELKTKESYNWGYNPSQFFVPEGSYATKPNDPYNRINELKEMIDIYHKNNIGVIMDVVYNHVDNHLLFPYEILVPGYSFRIDDQALMTDFSGCKNDLDTSRPMIKRLIIDSLSYWLKTYQIDGFRFDLMGLIDYNTMNEVVVQLKKIKPDLIIYGEGWKIDDNKSLAHMFNPKLDSRIAFFNDEFRDIVKGSTFEASHHGFSLGNLESLKTVVKIFQGKGLLKASQSINYLACHDNQTLYDKAMTVFNNKEKTIDHQIVGTCMTILAPGTPFIHSGQEFYRSKNKASNSYNLSDDINKISWRNLDLHYQDVQFIKTIIKLRKSIKNYQIMNVVKIDSGFYIQVSGFEIYFIVKEGQKTIVNDLQLHTASRPILIEDGNSIIKDIGVYIFERTNQC